MKQIKGFILKLNDRNKHPLETLREITELIENDWIIVDKSITPDAIIYILAKVPEEMLQKLAQRQTLQNVLKLD